MVSGYNGTMTMVNQPKKRPSMQDVATLAGVSRTTASFVINNVDGSGIPEETRRRVWDAVKQLGYRPNAIARGLRSAKTSTIGFISDEVATSPFAGEIIHGAQDRAWEDEMLLLLVNTGGNQAMKRVAVETLLQRQVEGIVYATMYHREVHPPEGVRQVPTVLLDCYVADASLPSVVPDEVVTIRTHNFPPNRTFVVMMGHMGTHGIEGTPVGTFYSGIGGTMTATFPIPVLLKGLERIAIRAEATPFYAYSRSILEALVPYASAALDDFLHARPEQYCGARTARAMAMVAL